MLLPLYNFDTEASTVVELDGARIIPLAQVPEKLRSLSSVACKYWLEIDETENDPRGAFDRALVVMKLFKDAVVTSNVYVSPDSTRRLRHYKIFTKVPRNYFLEASEVESFRAFWNEFRSISTREFVVRSFHDAIYRPYLNQRIVDYVVTLENLLVPDGIAGKVAYRFRTRGAVLLASPDTPEVKRRVYTDLNKYYTIRSQQVHGGKWKGPGTRDGDGWEELLRPIRNYAREAIVYFHREGCLMDAEKRRQFILEKTVLR